MPGGRRGRQHGHDVHVSRRTRITHGNAGITLTIVLLVVRIEAPWIIAIHRFLEISIGIAVALILTALWSEAKPASP